MKDDRDWTEDFQHENGRYLTKCHQCEEMFEGHKRRVICKLCAVPEVCGEKPWTVEDVMRMLDEAAILKQYPWVRITDAHNADIARLTARIRELEGKEKMLADVTSIAATRLKALETLRKDHEDQADNLEFTSKENESLRSRLAIQTEALTKLRDCNWIITPRDRMDAVRDIARLALAQSEGKSDS